MWGERGREVGIGYPHVHPLSTSKSLQTNGIFLKATLIERGTGYNSFSADRFCLKNGVDLDFIWVFTVCQNTRLEIHSKKY